MSSSVSTTGRKAISPWSITTRRIVLGAIFAAMTLALGSVGFGFIPVPNASGAGTVLHIPTILGAMALIAFPVFGPLVHLPSRILIGLVAWALYTVLRKANVNIAIAAFIAAIAGTLTNTILTVGTVIL